MFRRCNRRGCEEHYVSCEHLELEALKKEAQKIGLKNQYLKKKKKSIPRYPRPEIHASRLKHDTDQDGLRGIRAHKGFRVESELLWWGLDVQPQDIQSAETRLLQSTFPDRTEEQAQMQWSFLRKFASSPAFLRSSRLGPYHFSFSLKEVLEAYSQQFCCGEEPIMRVYETVLYKQEVMYSVLVHSPANMRQFSKYPLLTDYQSSICNYDDDNGCFIWRPQAMCATHRFKLTRKPLLRQLRGCCLHPHRQYYVWDNVAIALHVGQQVLEFDADQLRNNLELCDIVWPFIGGRFDSHEEAKAVIDELWPRC